MSRREGDEARRTSAAILAKLDDLFAGESPRHAPKLNKVRLLFEQLRRSNTLTRAELNELKEIGSMTESLFRASPPPHEFHLRRAVIGRRIRELHEVLVDSLDRN